jgi:hypothetical protein
MHLHQNYQNNIFIFILNFLYDYDEVLSNKIF